MRLDHLFLEVFYTCSYDLCYKIGTSAHDVYLKSVLSLKKYWINSSTGLESYIIGKKELSINIPKEIMPKRTIATLIIEVNNILTISRF